MRLPPGPDLPASRVAQVWIEQPVEFWQACAARYGETFTIELGSVGTTVLFAHPEAVREIFQLAPETYECGPFNGHYNSVMGANSLLVSDGARHRRMQRVLMPPLHRRLIETRGEAILGVVRRSLAGWPVGQAFSPRPMLHLISLEVVLGMLFGSAEDGLAREILRVFSQEIYQDLGSWSAWMRFMHYQPRLRGLIAEEAGRRRAAPEPAAGGAPLFDVLVRARDEDGAPVPDAEIQDHIFTMLVAGVDPTALALAWALYWILGVPEALARLRREIDELGPGAAPARIAGLPYLTAACQEALRMYPVVITPTGRKLVAPAEIQGRWYAPGVTLVPCTYLVHHRAETFPEPGRFRPERFLGRQYAPHEYFPFGGGARTCIGASLAPLEMKLVLAEILAQCDLVPAHEGPVRPVRHGTLLAPSDAMRFVLNGRRSEPGVPQR